MWKFQYKASKERGWMQKWSIVDSPMLCKASEQCHSVVSKHGSEAQNDKNLKI